MSYVQEAIYHSEGVEVCFPILPNGVNRHHVEDVLIDVGRVIGLSSSLLHTLLTLIKKTRPSDWTNSEVEPICYVQQITLARGLKKSDRQMRNDESELCRLNLITKHVSGNGSRGRIMHSDGSEYRQGIVFTPLIEAYEDLVQLRKDRAKQDVAFQTLKRHCSALRRNIKNALADMLPEDPTNAKLIDLAEMAGSWPRGYSHLKTELVLRAHHDELVTASQIADDLRILCNDISGRPESDVRPYIQDTTEDLIVPCIRQEDKGTACKQSDTHTSSAEPCCTEDGLGNKCVADNEERKSEFLRKLSPWQLKELCSDEMKSSLEYHQGDRPSPSVMDFARAAIDRVPQLGISNSAYRDAVEQMSDMGTALCILIIDRNQHHPVTPIKNPGGALRAMTRRHAHGTLNLAGGLIGLSQRAKVDLR